MTKKIKLSHSAAEKYKTCGALYKFHYIDRLRPIMQGSALYFGSAVDEALNVLLESKKINTKKEESLNIIDDAITTFKLEWYKQIDNSNIEYFKSDIDFSLLGEDAIDYIKKFDPEIENHEEFLEDCYSLLKEKVSLCKEDQDLYNLIAWHSLETKGKLLISAYYKDILPKIHKVHSIQQKVELPDENGNMLIGYIDAVVSFVDEPDKKVVLDNKTSSKPYAIDSVTVSPQLSTYAEFENTEYGAYAVVEKHIRKLEPKTRTQLIIDKIPEKTIDETFEMYDNVLEGIENQEFEKNYDSGCFFFGRKCSYYDYCRSNGKNKKGLKET